MLIDDFLPRYDVRERHHTEVRAPAGRVYAAVRRLDLSGARLSMFLFRLRGLPAAGPARFTLDDFLRMRFILLGERPGEELLLGLVGRFWTPSGGLRPLDPEGFRAFDEPGYAKAVWNFSLDARAGGPVSLATETRVCCTDEAARRRFRLYWLLVGPFSALIRREVLQAVRRSAEEQG